MVVKIQSSAILAASVNVYTDETEGSNGWGAAQGKRNKLDILYDDEE